METQVKIEFSFQDVIAELGKVQVEEILTAENSDVVAMSCCNKTDAVCWTQM